MTDYGFIFETRGDAFDALTQMRNILKEGGVVTVADLCNLVGGAMNYSDKCYGWFVLPAIVDILRVRSGYILDLPKPTYIKPMRNSRDERPKVSYVSYNNFYKNDHWNRVGKPHILDVKFYPPATIVWWSDGTKTVVKCDKRDVFDAEKGLAMAISKKMFGNNYDYFEVFKKWSDPYLAEENAEEPENARTTFVEPRPCTTCRHFEVGPGDAPCVYCFGFKNHPKYELSEERLVNKAYSLLVKSRETGDFTLVDYAIGYLGEALE